MLTYAVLSSGSIGNSYVFFDGIESIVVDVGISNKQMSLRLENAGVPESSIKAVFVTHLHPDHVKGAKAFLKGRNIPIYINSLTAKKQPILLVRSNIPTEAQEFFNVEEPIKAGGSTVIPFSLSHDSPGTVGYRISSIRSDKTAVIITDTGYVPDEAYKWICDSDILFLEANYDEDLLKIGPYPKELQERIRGERGHLSNEQAVSVVQNLSENPLRKIHLIHVSENNNTVDSIKSAFEKVDASLYSSLIPLERGEFYKGYVQ